MESKKIRKYSALALAVLLLIYVGYQVYLAAHKGLTTEPAMYATVSDTVNTTGFAIRNEQPISASYSGVISYQISDGTRVEKGGTIAEVYATEADAMAQNQIARIDSEIKSLSTLSTSGEHYVANPDLISTQINTSLEGVSSAIRLNHFSQLPDLKQNLLLAFNRKQIITGAESAEDYSSRIDALENEKADIAASAGNAIDSITADIAGYFISSTDGLEASYDIGKIQYMTAPEAKTLLEKGKGEGSGALGKICTDFNWYLVCVLTDNEVVKFEDVTNVSVDIPFATTEKIPAQVIAKNRDASTGDTAVVLECSYMDSDLALVRNETIQINVHTYSGVLVNEKAIRFSDVPYTETDEDGNVTEKVQKNVKGVYIKYGGRLEFVQIFSDKTVNGYAICKTELNEDEAAALVTENTIQLYDEVVTEGTDLHDGKIVR